MRTDNALLLDGYAQSSGSANSSAFRLENFNVCSLQVIVASQSSYGATAKLQASNDVGPDGFGGGVEVANWTDLANSGQTANIALAANGASLWNVDGIGFKWIRVVITWSAGSAVVSVRGNGKGPL